MKILKVLDCADVLGTVVSTGASFRVDLLQGEVLTSKEFGSYTTAERWLKSMVVTLATGNALKRGQGGRAKPLAHDRSPALGSAPGAPRTRLKHERAA